MNSTQKAKFDEDISKILIVNEVSSAAVNVQADEEISSFWVLHIQLKRRDYSDANIILLTKLIQQNMLFVLECEEKYQLVVYRNKLIKSGWSKPENVRLTLQGLNMREVWENIIAYVGNISIAAGATLDEQMQTDEHLEELKKELATLEKKMKTERQPKKKYELYNKISALKAKINSIVR